MTRLSSAEFREECRDLCDHDEGEPHREPGPGEVECDECDGKGGDYFPGPVPWVDEAVRCDKCKGSGVMPAPESNVHPLFGQLLAPFAPPKV